MASRFPDFLEIGAQKAGTTWLHENLRRHPAIWLPPVKELQYFNELYIPAHRAWTGKHRFSHGTRALHGYLDRTPRERWDYRFIGRTADIICSDISDEWYGSIFSLAPAATKCGEVTPEYSLLPPEGIEHVLRLSPEVKIILALRDPIERNWSHIRMIADDTAGGADLGRIARFPDLQARADYPAIIARWSEKVPADRMLITFMDDIASKPREVMSTLCGHLGIEYDEKFFPRLEEPIHVGKKLEIPADIYDLLKTQLRPIYERLHELFPERADDWMKRHYG
jgi:hypothetical protein